MKSIRSSVAVGLALVVAAGMTAQANGVPFPLLGSAAGNDELISIDRDSGLVQVIGQMNIPYDFAITGLAHDAVHDILYGISPSDDRLYIVDAVTATVTPIGSIGALGTTNANGLAYDPVGNVLYASDNPTNSLYTVNPTTGVATLVGPIGFTAVEGLAFDPGSGTLFGLADGQGQVIVIDPGTGEAQALPDSLPTDDDTWRGLTFDVVTGMLFASSNEDLYQVDPASGAASWVGQLYPPVQGLAVIPEPTTLALLALGGLALLRRKRK